MPAARTRSGRRFRSIIAQIHRHCTSQVVIDYRTSDPPSLPPTPPISIDHRCPDPPSLHTAGGVAAGRVFLAELVARPELDGTDLELQRHREGKGSVLVTEAVMEKHTRERALCQSRKQWKHTRGQALCWSRKQWKHTRGQALCWSRKQWKTHDVSVTEAVETHTRERHCVSHGSSGNTHTRQRHCVGHESSGNTQRQGLRILTWSSKPRCTQTPSTSVSQISEQ